MNDPSLAARWRSSSQSSELDDAVQEVFVECFRAGGVLKRVDASRPGGLRPFLFGVVRNVALRFETRPVAFILSGEMAVAYFMGHAPHGFWPVLNQGSPAIFFCFLWLYVSAAGPGPWSLDALRHAARRSS